PVGAWHQGLQSVVGRRRSGDGLSDAAGPAGGRRAENSRHAEHAWLALYFGWFGAADSLRGVGFRSPQADRLESRPDRGHLRHSLRPRGVGAGGGVWAVGIVRGVTFGSRLPAICRAEVGGDSAAAG